MKKIFVVFFAAFIFLSAGCGEKVEYAVKSEVADVQKDAASKVSEVAGEVSQKAAQVAGSNAPAQSVQEISLGGISPGMTLAEIKNILGEPVSHHDHDEFIFANGVEVEIDDHRDVAKEIKTHQAGVQASGGVAVGTSEQDLLAALGEPARKDFDDGATEYKYFSSDRTKKIVFKVFDGKVTEIQCELDD